jgi:hypothetical protein
MLARSMVSLRCDLEVDGEVLQLWFSGFKVARPVAEKMRVAPEWG